MILQEKDFQKGLKNLTFHEFLNKINWVSENGNTPLMFLFQNNKKAHLNFNQEQITKIIKKSDLTAQNALGQTPLMILMQHNPLKERDLEQEIGMTQIFSLIENSDFTQVDDNGFTALHFILKNNLCYNNKLLFSPKEIINLLQKANFEQYDSKKQNILWTILENNYQLNLKKDQLLPIINKNDFLHQDVFGQNILMLVLKELDHTNDTSFLLKIIKKSNLMVYDDKRQTPLMKMMLYLSSNSFREISKKNIKYILNNSDINFQDEQGKTPLMLALVSQPALVPFILIKKPNLLLKDNEGKTTLDYAYKNKNFYLLIEKMTLSQQTQTKKGFKKNFL